MPGKLVALKGPVDLGGAAEYRDDASGARTFSPAFCGEILLGMGVSTVVRLNELRYPAEALASQGLTLHSLEFPDCSLTFIKHVRLLGAVSMPKIRQGVRAAPSGAVGRDRLSCALSLGLKTRKNGLA